MAFRRHVQTIAPGAASDRFFMGLLVIVDVRSEAEWKRVRVPGATHIPLSQVTRRLHEVRTDRPVAFVCGSGHRSALAARRAARQRDDVASVEGGMNAWLAAGLPAARCTPPRAPSSTNDARSSHRAGGSAAGASGRPSVTHSWIPPRS
ncbi:MAG TPA: rhodanese-like domain-containing protein [Baekduia sp.]|nr:rhodanese-like domain-containing protein [Baekduia sp.]